MNTADTENFNNSSRVSYRSLTERNTNKIQARTAFNSLLPVGAVPEGELEQEESLQRDGMTRQRMLAYSIGHFSNDLCASMWFIYQSYYYLNVLQLSNEVTGMALLCGQLTDGIATPIVGLLSDKYDSCWGKRNTFYIIGSVIVIPSFLCIFTAPIWTNAICRNVWYVVWPMIFNVGWASVQVAHMAVVNSLTYDAEKRDKMINSRNGFTYAANIAMLSFSMVLFLFERHSLMQFRVLSITCVLLGTVSTCFYVCFIKEEKLAAEATYKEAKYEGINNLITPGREGSNELRGGDGPDDTQAGWGVWLKRWDFYICALVYMFARVALNVTATVMPLYLTETLGFVGKGTIDTSFAIAAVPLYAYICSMLFSVFGQSYLQVRFRSRRVPMLAALVLTCASSLPMLFLDKIDWCKQLVYPSACVQGVGIALMLNTSTSMISDVIGTQTQSAAFVYGAYSFVDKTANGLFLFWLIASYSMDAGALQTCIGTIPSICSVLCALLSYALPDLPALVDQTESERCREALELSKSPLNLKSPYPRWQPLSTQNNSSRSMLEASSSFINN